MKNIFVILILALCVVSCQKEETIEFTDSPIIEAYISVDEVFQVKISRQIPFSSDVSYSQDDIDLLNIQLEHNGNVCVLNPLGNGVYVDSSITICSGDNFNLSFEFNSKEVTAYTYIPSKPINVCQSETEMSIERMDSSSVGPPSFTEVDPIVISWDNLDQSYYLILIENIENTLDPIRDMGDEDPPNHVFRKSPNDSNTEEFQSREFQYYGTHRVVIFHVLPDYAALYDLNSTSSQNLINPSSSITNAYGIFTGLNSDTLWIEIKEP